MKRFCVAVVLFMLAGVGFSSAQVISGGSVTAAANPIITGTGGAGSILITGQANTASNTSGVSFGQANAVTGSYSSVVGGLQAQDRGRYGASCYASGIFGGIGDAQYCTNVLRGTGATTSAFRLTSDGGAAGSSNCVNMPTNAAYQIRIAVVAFDHTTVTNSEEWGQWNGLLVQGANAAATTLKMDATPTPQTNGTVTGSGIVLTADTSNGCLNATFTPPSGNTDTWRAVATVTTIETQ